MSSYQPLKTVFESKGPSTKQPCPVPSRFIFPWLAAMSLASL